MFKSNVTSNQSLIGTKKKKKGKTMENNNYAAGYTYGSKEAAKVSLRVQFGSGARRCGSLSLGQKS